MWGQRCVPLREITVPSIIFYLYTVRRMYHFVLFCWLTHNLDSVPGAQGPQETPLRWWYHFHKYVPWIGELFHIGKQNLEVARWFTATWGQRWLAFSAGKLGQWHPVFLHLFQVQKPHDAGHALEMFSEQTNPSQVVQLLLFLSRKSLSSAQVTGAEGQWPQLLGQRRATSNFSQAPRWLSWVQVKSSMLLSLMIRLVGYMSSHAGSNIFVVAHSLQVTGQVDLTCFPTVSSSQKLCNCQQLKWLPKRQTPVFLWSSQRALHEQVSSALGFEFDKQTPGSNGFPSKSTHETCLFR